jgi:hypothetical protein
MKVDVPNAIYALCNRIVKATHAYPHCLIINSSDTQHEIKINTEHITVKNNFTFLDITVK